MEDFQAAFLERYTDFNALDRANRHTAAMHFGGIAIECLLKAILSASLPPNANGDKEWKTEANNPGHTIYNPGHSYHAALRAHNKLRARVQNNPSVLKWLHDVEYVSCHFIDMRYVGTEPEDQKYKQWKRSYTSLIRWLQEQSTRL